MKHSNMFFALRANRIGKRNTTAPVDDRRDASDRALFYKLVSHAPKCNILHHL